MVILTTVGRKNPCTAQVAITADDFGRRSRGLSLQDPAPAARAKDITSRRARAESRQPWLGSLLATDAGGRRYRNPAANGQDGLGPPRSCRNRRLHQNVPPRESMR